MLFANRDFQSGVAVGAKLFLQPSPLVKVSDDSFSGRSALDNGSGLVANRLLRVRSADKALMLWAAIKVREIGEVNVFSLFFWLAVGLFFRR